MYPAARRPMATRRRVPDQLQSGRLLSRRRHGGFTLVEMLVVITIIGILAGLAVPVVFNAIRTARNAAILVEMANIENAIEQYKSKYGDYPVDCTEKASTFSFNFSSPVSPTNVPWARRIGGRHLRKISRRATNDFSDGRTNGANGKYTTAMITDLVNKYGAGNVTVTDQTIILDQIDPAEALVFCLRGYSKNVAFPWTGPGGPINFSPTANRTQIFEFEEDRLVDSDFDGFPHYVPPHGPPVPYVYFDARTYNYPNAFYDPSASMVSRGAGISRAYLSEATAKPLPVASATTIDYMNAKQFQLLCAGLDGDYGGGFTTIAQRKSYPNGSTTNAALNIITYSREDNDNISNFSGDIFENKFED